MENVLPIIITIALGLAIAWRMERERSEARPVLARIPVEPDSRGRRRRRDA